MSDEYEFKEPFRAKLRRICLGLAYAVRPKRVAVLPALMLLAGKRLFSRRSRRDLLPERPTFYAREGLVGISDDLSPEHLLEAYRKGYYPMCHLGPMKWWSPAQRAVLDPAEAHIPKNIRRYLRTGRFRVTFDQEFARVVEACAAPRSGKTALTWITPRVMQAFLALHRAGHAHSVEVWDAAGHLVGGVYGLAVGDVFFGESQFSQIDHASKFAVAVLHRHLADWGFKLRDAKNLTSHLTSLGFKAIDRASFETLLAQHASRPGKVGRWTVDPHLNYDGSPIRNSASKNERGTSALPVANAESEPSL